MALFDDRADAGRQLASMLDDYRGRDLVVLGLPRGGVPVAAAVAKRLHAPLDVIVVRKLGLSFEPEVAMGAIGEEGVYVRNARVLAQSGVPDAQLRAVERRERPLLEARVAELRAGRPRVELAGRIALIVDDGVATGSTARAACQVARLMGAARVVLAAPVIAAGAVTELQRPAGECADRVISVAAPFGFASVGQYYRHFDATTNADVTALLAASGQDPPRQRPSWNATADGRTSTTP
ncbi:phosphoribosyltransferase [Cryobacterium sp.]|jgi:putative phosphoribosyl transferase|uniref:phosphoribosyltransferase n=1 Tax=Cryobacterium sp. TaxID=1926290 RepID=UPI0026318C48|nr:phosphoribosyltransferase family protein [Cryobacterium sp.]MCU1445260.1 phosphoribosyl transferase [Cryobacterium sp.]